MKKINIIRILFSLMVVALAASCTKDTGTFRSSGDIEGVITIKIPGGGFQVLTRSLTAADEHFVQTVDVLVFNETGGQKKFYELVQPTLINGTAATKSFKLAVTSTTDPLQFVVLANSRNVVSGLTLTTSMTRDDVLKLVKDQLTAGNGWNSTTDTYDPLPMWGETDFAVRSDAASVTADVTLLRALARIDVNVAAGATNDFTISTVSLHNSSRNGRFAPTDAVWNKTDGKVTGISVPDGGIVKNLVLEYAVTGNSLQRSVYTYEAPASTSNKDINATFLVIKGSWKGEPDSYYRVDFYDEDNDAFLPLLRNHLYDIQITSVSGVGYPTAAEAILKGYTNNLSAVTHKIDESLMVKALWDGDNYLTVGDTTKLILRPSQQIAITVKTNYENGWSTTLTAKPDNLSSTTWVSISSGGLSPIPALGHIVLDFEENASGGTREAELLVKAGRLQQVIKITQKHDEVLSLEVSEVEFIFPTNVPADASARQSLRIEWEPANIPCTLENNAVEGYQWALMFTGGNTLPTSLADADGDPSNGGLYILEFKPNSTVIGMFNERRSTLDIKAKNSSGTEIIKKVLLRQFDYAIQVTGLKPSGSYQPNTTYEFTVKANGLWEVVGINGSAIASSNIADLSMEPNVAHPDILKIKTSNNVGTSTTLTFRLKEFPTVLQNVVIKLDQYYPNSYIVTPGSSIDIPVMKAFFAWETDVDLKPTAATALSGTMSAELLWQDEDGLITSAPTLVGSDRNGKITVQTTPGKEGNAVVVLKFDGVIRWSWHLWVANYDAEATIKTNTYNGVQFMDRNLGALNNTQGDANTLGLYYQFGRETPFPSPDMISPGYPSPRQIYNSSGPLIHGTTGMMYEPVALYNNLIKAMANPLTFYTTDDNRLDPNWYSDTDNAGRYDTWFKYDKELFDPCPEGWNVPKFGASVMFEKVPLPALFNLGANLKCLDGTDMGFFTSSGYLHFVMGKYVSVNTVTYLWYSYSNGSVSSFSKDLIFKSGGTSKANAVPVRCVKTK